MNLWEHPDGGENPKNISYLKVALDDRAYERRVCGITLVEEDAFNDLVVNFPIEPARDYYLLLAVYEASDSEDNSSREIEYIDLFATLETAEENQRRIIEHDRAYQERSRFARPSREETPLLLKLEDGRGYRLGRPWHGYHNGLKYVEVVTVRLDGRDRRVYAIRY